jgi:SEC-C motif domain protein
MECYCGSEKDFDVCCKPLIDGLRLPSSAEELMRSRYSAFAVRDFNYLQATHDPETLPQFDLDSNRLWANKVHFLKLAVLESKESSEAASVEFKAYFRDEDQVHCHHELSQFRKIGPKWYYSQGSYPG